MAFFPTEGEIRIVANEAPARGLRIELARGRVILPKAWEGVPQIEVQAPPGVLRYE